MSFEFVEASASERGDVASYLLALADEKGIDRRAIKTARGGYLVPAELLATDGVEVTAFKVSNDGPTVAEKDAEELPVVEVTFEADGVYTKPAEEVDREIIRDWAKAEGLQVADKGALKKVILEAYASAHAAE